MDDFLFGDETDDDLPRIPVRMMKVAIYTRKSNESEGKSKSQAQQAEHSLETGEHYRFEPDNITVYHDKEGVKGEWYWEDSAGRNPGPYRPELTRLMRDIEAGRINVLIVWRSDRLYRDPGVCSAIISVLKKHKVRLIIGRWIQDLNSAEGAYQAVVDAAANRKQRDRASEDIRRDQLWKAKHGMLTRDPSCLGFRSGGRGSQQAVPIRDEIEVVRRVFTLYVLGENGAGPMGYRAIARYCRENGIRVTSGAKKQKTKYPERVESSQIASILQNPMYVGRWRHAEREYQCDKLLVPARDGSDAMETVVPVALYEAAQQKRTLRNRPGKRSLSYEHLLSGLMVCMRCGRPLHVNIKYTGTDGKANKSWRCRWYGTGQCTSFGLKLLQEEATDEWVIRELAPVIAAEIREMRSASGREAGVHALAEVERQIRIAQEAETTSLRNMLNVLDQEQYGRLAAQLRAERQSLERKADEIRQRLEHLDIVAPDITAEDLGNMPRSALKDALVRCIKWIAVGKEGIVAHTRIGTYIAAPITKASKRGPRGSGPRLIIGTPSPVSVLECLDWFPDVELFIQGRRDFSGPGAEAITDEDILPGAFGQSALGPGVDIEVTYEALDKAS